MNLITDYTLVAKVSIKRQTRKDSYLSIAIAVTVS